MEPRPKTSQYARIFRKPPIQVIVGSAKVPYYVHPEALSWCKNSALSAQIEGPWRQHGDESPIDWSDFDEQTVECVLSYLYTQDYYVPQLEVAPDDSCESKDDCKEPIVSESTPDNQKLPNRPLTPLGRCLEAGLPANKSLTAAGTCTDEAIQYFNDSRGAEILIHAKVYCFAHRYCIRELEVFALQRLTKSLLILDADEEAVFSYVADAIRVVYGSTPGAYLQDNPARKLLSQYVAIYYTLFTLLGCESFDRVMAEGGDFVVDLSHKLARRLRTTGLGARSLEEQMDELQLKVSSLKQGLNEHEDQLQSAKEEFMEWDSWNRGIGKNKKAKRKV
ncbi:hypothetical protein BO83DRAFT_414210 [Aspergillus eucalypticola CBS 122712]|uniref:BTB domain-containing protein n=1 Tax=Aspergillus eucalypticola (strain CBS 122712 / IBT 29274) TaxID=1448314 RepID=A0A317WCD1_ASPEC|nr:uncharacterized protein BO83DRAFT_414210 [Aspergillus eucalypticola CBS 122712]PWY82688.1 hypothetical protein BO83DRAFT_414210 [Aspergillus eucalypticola CBS 122712]